MIYHITNRAAWQAAENRGCYSAPSLTREGFIHGSAKDQILRVANDFYRGVPDLLLLCIDENRLSAELRWEAPAHPDSDAAELVSSDALFPHIYGVLNLDAVTAAIEFSACDDGFTLPQDLPGPSPSPRRSLLR